MKYKVFMMMVLCMTSLLGAVTTASAAGTLVLETASLKGEGFVTVPLSIIDNTVPISSVTMVITYDGSSLALSPKSISLASDTMAAGWQLHISSTPPLQTGIKGVQLNLYKDKGVAISGGVITLADIQLNVLNATTSTPFRVSSLMVRDEAGVEITGYTVKNAGVLRAQP